MGCYPFANSHFQMGVTVMGFAEHFGHCMTLYIKGVSKIQSVIVESSTFVQ